MPSTRPNQVPAEKRSQLIASARSLFLSDGFESTSMARIAKAARVTPGTIYWYFKDKDELLIAVMDELLEEDLAAYVEVAQSEPAEQLVWLVGRMRRIQRLISTIHSRMRESAAIDQRHSQFHAIFEQLLTGHAPTPWTAHERAAEVRIVAFTIEGLVAHGVGSEEIRQACEMLAARWSQGELPPKRAISKD